MSIERELAYFTECQLATVQHFEGLSRFPIGELDRHRSIAMKMVAACREYGVPVDGHGQHGTPRLRKLLVGASA